MRKPRKPRPARPITRIALKQREALNTDVDMHSPIGLPWREEEGRASGTPSASQGGGPPPSPPPPEKGKSPCGCGGAAKPLRSLKPDGSPMSPREQVETFLQAQAEFATSEGKRRAASQLELFDELLNSAKRY